VLTVGWSERLWWGFAHLFRPTCAGANMGHPGFA
jgi:hypothetical protein